MILAHVTKQPFPMSDAIFLWTVVGAIDANMPLLFNRYAVLDWSGPIVLTIYFHRSPLIQHNMHNTSVVVFLTLGMSILSYARFCTLVINDITNYLGIACFTVRKKDMSGVWRRAQSVDKIMVGKKQ